MEKTYTNSESITNIFLKCHHMYEVDKSTFLILSYFSKDNDESSNENKVLKSIKINCNLIINKLNLFYSSTSIYDSGGISIESLRG